jgi:hypothetical protein
MAKIVKFKRFTAEESLANNRESASILSKRLIKAMEISVWLDNPFSSPDAQAA